MEPEESLVPNTSISLDENGVVVVSDPDGRMPSSSSKVPDTLGVLVVESVNVGDQLR